MNLPALLLPALLVGGSVEVGLQRLMADGWAPLLGRRVAVFGTPAAVDPQSLVHLVDLLQAQPSVQLVGILAAEHGFRGDRQAEHGDPPEYIDRYTGLRVFSVYRRSRPALERILERLGADVLLCDFQDVGVRLYTFAWTMVALAQAAGSRTVIVLDRPNPLGGQLVSGPRLDLSSVGPSRYGTVAGLPHRHGLTAGEICRLAGLNVTVYRMKGWERGMTWKETGLPWIPPSPNLPSAASAAAYVATVFVEATTVAEGRGTCSPFQVLGAPFVNNSLELARQLNSRLAAPLFRAAFFEPQFFKYNLTECGGVQYVRTGAVDSFVVTIQLLQLLRESYREFAWDGSWFGWGHNSTLFDLYAGTTKLRLMLEAGKDPEEIVRFFADGADAFKRERLPFLLY